MIKYVASWWIGDRFTRHNFLSRALEYDADNLHGLVADAERQFLISPSEITVSATGRKVYPKEGRVNGSKRS